MSGFQRKFATQVAIHLESANGNSCASQLGEKEVKIGETSLEVPRVVSPNSMPQFSKDITQKAITPAFDGFNTCILCVGAEPAHVLFQKNGIASQIVGAVAARTKGYSGNVWQVGMSAYSMLSSEVIDFADNRQKKSIDSPVAVLETQGAASILGAFDDLTRAIQQHRITLDDDNFVLRIALFDRALGRGSFIQIVGVVAGSDNTSAISFLTSMSKHSISDTQLDDMADKPLFSMLLSIARDSSLHVIGALSSSSSSSSHVHRDANLALATAAASCAEVSLTCSRHTCDSFQDFTGAQHKKNKSKPDIQTQSQNQSGHAHVTPGSRHGSSSSDEETAVSRREQSYATNDYTQGALTEADLRTDFSSRGGDMDPNTVLHAQPKVYETPPSAKPVSRVMRSLTAELSRADDEREGGRDRVVPTAASGGAEAQDGYRHERRHAPARGQGGADTDYDALFSITDDEKKILSKGKPGTRVHFAEQASSPSYDENTRNTNTNTSTYTRSHAKFGDNPRHVLQERNQETDRVHHETQRILRKSPTSSSAQPCGGGLASGQGHKTTSPEMSTTRERPRDVDSAKARVKELLQRHSSRASSRRRGSTSAFWTERQEPTVSAGTTGDVINDLQEAELKHDLTRVRRELETRQATDDVMGDTDDLGESVVKHDIRRLRQKAEIMDDLDQIAPTTTAATGVSSSVSAAAERRRVRRAVPPSVFDDEFADEPLVRSRRVVVTETRNNSEEDPMRLLLQQELDELREAKRTTDQRYLDACEERDRVSAEYEKVKHQLTYELETVTRELKDELETTKSRMTHEHEASKHVFSEEMEAIKAQHHDEMTSLKAEHERQLALVQAELASLQEDYATLQSTSQEQVSSWKDTYIKLQETSQDEVHQLQRELKDAKQDIEMHANSTERIQKLMTQLETSSRLTEEFQEEIKRSREDASKLRADNVALIQKTEDQERMLHRLQTDLEEAQEQLDMIGLERESKTADMRSLKSEKIEVVQQNDRLKLQVEALENELQLAAASHSSLRETVKEERDVSKQLRVTLKDLQRKLSKCQDELQTASVERDAHSTSLAEADQHGKTLQEQVTGFRDKLEGAAKRIDQLKKQKDAAAKHEQDLIRVLARVHELVSQSSAHAARCASKGQFAIKAKRVADDATTVFEQLIDHLAEGSGAFKTRRDVLQAIKDHQSARER